MGKFGSISVSGQIIIWCWIIVGVYWFVSAFSQKKTTERQSLLAELKHRIPLFISYCLVFSSLFDQRKSAEWARMNLVITPTTDWARAVAVLVCVFGLSVTLWARWTLSGNWSANVTFKKGHELVRRGPYGFVRHPIYTGLLIMCLGTAIEIARLRAWLALPLMAIAFWIKLKQEERLMLSHFPDEYREYQTQVKALVPFVL